MYNVASHMVCQMLTGSPRHALAFCHHLILGYHDTHIGRTTHRCLVRWDAENRYDRIHAVCGTSNMKVTNRTRIVNERCTSAEKKFRPLSSSQKINEVTKNNTHTEDVLYVNFRQTKGDVAQFKKSIRIWIPFGSLGSERAQKSTLQCSVRFMDNC